MMNKHFKLLFFVMLFCQPLLAQRIPGVNAPSTFRYYSRDYKISIGPKVGAGLTIGSASNLYNFGSSVGLGVQGGLAINAHFGRRSRLGDGGTGWFGAEVEALYCYRRLQWDKTSVGFSCIEFPVLGQVYPIPKLGVEVGFTLVKILGLSPDMMSSGLSYMSIGQIRAKDVMLTTGACYTIKGFMADVRFNLGFSNLAGNFDVKVSSAMFSFAYLIPILK